MLSLKERFAQKKTDKKIKQLERTAKQPEKRLSHYQHKKSLRQATKFEQVQRANRIALVMDNGECTPPEQIAQIMQSDKQALDDLIYYRNMPQASTSLELTLRMAKIMANVLQDTSPNCSNSLLDTVAKAEYGFNQATQADQSPNQRRTLFYWLDYLIEEMAIWHGMFSKKAIEIMANYNTGVQVAVYFLLFYRLPENVVLSAVRTIGGDSIRQLAKQYQIKEPELRYNILIAAKYLYRIGVTQEPCKDIEPALSIPQMREKAWQYLNDFDRLVTISANAVHGMIKPFHLRYGIALINLIDYEKEIVAIQKRIFQAA